MLNYDKIHSIGFKAVNSVTFLGILGFSNYKSLCFHKIIMYLVP